MTDTLIFDLSALAHSNIPSRRLDADERVFLAGEEGHEMFVVKSGRIAIKGGGMILENVKPGGVFGEMAVIDGSPRSATAIAMEPSEVAVLAERDFLGLVSAYPEFALTVMQLMARRIRRTNESL